MGADGVEGWLGLEAAIQRSGVGERLVVENKRPSTSIFQRWIDTEVGGANDRIAYLVEG
jgi:hypothetical protein